MSDNSSKEVEIKSGISLKTIFDGELIIGTMGTKEVATLPQGYKICFFKLADFESEKNGILFFNDNGLFIGNTQGAEILKIQNNKFIVENKSPYQTVTIKKIEVLI